MTDHLTVLVVEDNEDDAELIQRQLSRGFTIEAVRVDQEDAMREAVEQHDFDLVICDFRMPRFNVPSAMAVLEEGKLDIPFIVVSGTIEEAEAVSLMEAGVRDFVLKDKMDRLVPAIRRELRDAEVRRALVERERAVARAKAERQQAEARAALVDELEAANREIRETQGQLVQAAKMASLGELVAGITHEVNNPLSYAMSHLGTVEDALAALDPCAGDLDIEARARSLAKAQKRMGDIREGLDRVRDLVQKLRTFARMEGGEFKRFDVREGIESVLRLLSHRVGPGVELKTRFAETNTIDCVPGTLQQAVMNIVANALDAIGDSGSIEIETMYGDAYSIVVRDDGPGIPDHIKDRIFEPFYTTKPVGKGMGLGLSTTYRIIERHDGCIDVEDRKGGGTEFCIVLPLQPNCGKEA